MRPPPLYPENNRHGNANDSRDYYQDKKYQESRGVGPSPDMVGGVRASHEFDLSNKRNLLPMSENMDRIVNKERKGKKMKKVHHSPDL